MKDKIYSYVLSEGMCTTSECANALGIAERTVLIQFNEFVKSVVLELNVKWLGHGYDKNTSCYYSVKK